MSGLLSVEDSLHRSKVAVTPLSFVERRISEIESANLLEVSVFRLVELLRPLLEIYVNQPLEFERACSVFRARKNEGELFFDEVKRLWTPPADRAKLNRANIDGEQVFYCSTELENAVFELKPCAGDIVTVLRADLKGNESPRLISLGIRELAQRYGVAIGGEPTDLLDEFFGHDGDSRRKIQLIDAFLIEEFTRLVPEGDEYRHLYKITAAIAQWCYRLSCLDGPVDGIVYPSVQSGGVGACIALLPGSVNRLFSASACCVMEILDASSNRALGTRQGEAKSITEDGRIEWI
jgi:RES domain